MFRCPTLTCFKPGGLAQVSTYCKSLVPTVKNVLLITDKGLSKTNNINIVQNSLNNNNITYDIFDSVPQNPKTSTLNNIINDCNINDDSKYDLVIGLGGGSVIDASKCISMLMTNMSQYNKSGIESFIGANKYKYNPIPYISIPTTCGTGSEVTWVSVITNDNKDIDVLRKISIKGETMFPKLSLIDSDLLCTLPNNLISYTGMDALTHSIESYISNCSNPVSNALALESIKLIINYLPRATYKIKTDKFARENITYASTIAGLSFGNSDVGSIHCLSETLGAMYNLPHGLLNGSILYTALKYHKSYIKQQLIQICKYIDYKNTTLYNSLLNTFSCSYLDTLELDDIFLLMIDRLRCELGITQFNKLNINKYDYNLITQECIINGSNKSNIQNMNQNNYLELLNKLSDDCIEYIKSPCQFKT